MIQHTVAFRLAPEADEASFLRQAAALATVKGVENFRILRQIGQKNDFTHALSMHFADRRAYDGYNEHPSHVAFVNDVWLPNVAEFIELDYVAYIPYVAHDD